MVIGNFKGNLGVVITEASYVQKEADLKKQSLFWGFEMVFLMDPNVGFISLPRQEQRSRLESENIGNPDHIIMSFVLFCFFKVNSVHFYFPKVAIFLGYLPNYFFLTWSITVALVEYSGHFQTNPFVFAFKNAHSLVH